MVQMMFEPLNFDFIFFPVCFHLPFEDILVAADLDIGEHVYTIKTNDDARALSYGIVMVTDSFYFHLNTSNSRK